VSALIRRVAYSAGGTEVARLLADEWLVTNGLGGYASGTVGGVLTRRYHGLLVAALPAPWGRTVMLSALWERVRFPDRSVAVLTGEERAGIAPELLAARHLTEFRLEDGLPVWRYEAGGAALEKRLLMPYGQNTTYLSYRLLEGPEPVRLTLRPSMHVRPHNAPVSEPLRDPYTLTAINGRFEITAVAEIAEIPPLRLSLVGRGAFTVDPTRIAGVIYRVEAARGYESSGDLWSPGYFRGDLAIGDELTLVASTEPWQTLGALAPPAALATERARRRGLLAVAQPAARDGVAAELVLAADTFLVTPVSRVADTAHARATGGHARTVIAGYHWFTDWGRDTMIALAGLALVTGRYDQAGEILRTFGHYVRDGLIPNLFPEGETEGLYHTADASLWFFEALHRYLAATDDRATLATLLPVLVDIVEHHRRGTRFGIGVDPRDGLLRQGAPGYQLTWMDAKVGDWVVTPRRGKAVEINALWHNALRLLERWLEHAGGPASPVAFGEHAARAAASFNARFWCPDGWLYDVVDGEHGDDPACRPNQLLAISLTYPVLDHARWPAVIDAVRTRLVTPFGVRSLDPRHPDYKSRYDGDLRARDAAYHQGTVWPWLIGPFVDAWLRVHPHDRAGARRWLEGLGQHLSEACIGSISEIFDAEPPYHARGCVAQAWSVAEVLRAWVATEPATAPAGAVSDEAVRPGVR
jgi:predicted glycogen debranching enzyme